jgi:ribosomal protein S18 acetylase RimI-like enzyme
MIKMQLDQSNLEYEIAKEIDAQQVADLVNSAYRGDSGRQGWTTEADILGGQRTDSEQILKMIQNPQAVILLSYLNHDENMKNERRLIGCCFLENIADARTAYFGMFAIDPKIQALGIGKKMIEHAEQFVRNQWGARFMEMTVITLRQELIDWYERRGYEFTGEMREFPGDPAFGIQLRDGIVLGVWRKAL